MKGIVFIALLGLAHTAAAQDTVRLTLPDAIRLGQARSVDAVVARSEYVSAYWAWRTYRTELLPEVTLSATAPYYSKSYNQFQNQSGEYTYVGNFYNRFDAGLSIAQNIPWTGGQISVSGTLERMRQMGDNPSTRFMAVPASVTLEQPLFGLNRIKWLRKIEPVRFREAGLRIVSDFEDVALTVVGLYFNLLLAQTTVESAAQNVANSERLYSIARVRRTIGQISETELMQLRVALLGSRAKLTDAETDLKYQMFQLRSYLGFGEDEVLRPIVPEFDQDAIRSLDYDRVLAMARQNNSFTQNARRRLLEAEQAVSQARADRFDIRLFASIGVSGQEDRFHQVFNRHNWRDNQRVEVGLRIPILDWGKGKGRVMTARAKHEVAVARIEKERMDFDQNIFILVLDFNNQPTQLRLADETDEIARTRYTTTVEAFVAGMVDILNLNDAQSAKDAARSNYIRQLAALWSYHYRIRSLTLYDFSDDREIEIRESFVP